MSAGLSEVARLKFRPNRLSYEHRRLSALQIEGDGYKKAKNTLADLRTLFLIFAVGEEAL
jgi:hypothetical protein